MKLIAILFVFTFAIQCSKKQRDDVKFASLVTWKLNSLSGFEGKLEGNKGNPVLKINMADSSYSGHSGCNNYHGKLNVSGKGYLFKPGLTTKMYCDDDGLEKAYMKAIHSASEYSIEKEKLLLSNSKGVKAVFVKE